VEADESARIQRMAVMGGLGVIGGAIGGWLIRRRTRRDS
jgi:hypothetical protein